MLKRPLIRTEELTGLKRQINAMTSAVFGKNPLPELKTCNIHETAGLPTFVTMQDLALPILARICG